MNSNSKPYNYDYTEYYFLFINLMAEILPIKIKVRKILVKIIIISTNI